MLQKTYLVVSENSGSHLYRMQGDMASTRYHVQRSYASRGDVREDAYACACKFSSRILNKVREMHMVFPAYPSLGRVRNVRLRVLSDAQGLLD